MPRGRKVELTCQELYEEPEFSESYNEDLKRVVVLKGKRPFYSTWVESEGPKRAVMVTGTYFSQLTSRVLPLRGHKNQSVKVIGSCYSKIDI